MQLLATSLLTLAVAAQSFDGYSCDPNACKLPSCRCATRTPPVTNPPMFLLVTFDDSLQTNLMPTVNSLFTARNPNGCPSRGTFFAQVLEANPIELTKWYAAGHEIADHSVTHKGPFTGTYAEVEGMRAWANTYGGIPLSKITGFRHPFRAFTVDSINMLSKMGFSYESSMAANVAEERIWPYTLDNGAVTDCLGQSGICNKKLAAPGLWEVPMIGLDGLSISYRASSHGPL